MAADNSRLIRFRQTLAVGTEIMVTAIDCHNCLAASLMFASERIALEMACAEPPKKPKRYVPFWTSGNAALPDAGQVTENTCFGG